MEWGGGGIIGENGGWRVRGVIEINVRVRRLIISKFEMSLVKKYRSKKLIIQMSEYYF